VINALAKKQPGHVPYRNSKLTFLLQDSLSRSARVMMFVNIAPEEASASETICSLAFAARCEERRGICLPARAEARAGRNVALGPAAAKAEHAELALARQEITELKRKLQKLMAATPGSSPRR